MAGPPNTPRGTGSFQREGPRPDRGPPSTRLAAGCTKLFLAQLFQDSCTPPIRSGLGRWLDIKHPLNKYNITWIKEQSKDSVTGALPHCHRDSYKWLICSRNGLFFLSDSFLCLNIISLNEGPRWCSCGFGKLGGRGFSWVSPQLLQAAFKADIA